MARTLVSKTSNQGSNPCTPALKIFILSGMKIFNSGGIRTREGGARREALSQSEKPRLRGNGSFPVAENSERSER